MARYETLDPDGDLQVRSGSGASANEIAHAETSLGVTLPDDYKAFLRKYGWGGIENVMGQDVRRHVDLLANTCLIPRSLIT